MKHLLTGMLLFSLIGCAAPSDDLTDAPEITDEPTEISEVTAEPTEPPLPTLIAATQQAEITPTVDQEQVCRRQAESGLDLDASAPDLAVLGWESGTQGERYLLGLPSKPYNVHYSPDGRYLAATFYHGVQTQLPIASTLLLDMQGDQHRMLASSLLGFDGFYRWLSDQRFLWIDDAGQVHLDDRSLNAPEPMGKLEGVSGNIAFLRHREFGEPIWRVDLASGQWEPISTASGVALASLRGISEDGTYALLSHGMPPDGTTGIPLWRVPITMGSYAEYVMSIEADPLGMDGMIKANAAENLAGTDIWVIGGPFMFEAGGRTYGYEGVIVDLAQQRVLTADDFGLSPDAVILGGRVAEDWPDLLTIFPEVADSTNTDDFLVVYYAMELGYDDNSIFAAKYEMNYYTGGLDLKAGLSIGFEGGGDGVGGEWLTALHSQPYYIVWNGSWSSPLQIGLNERGARRTAITLDPAYDVIDESWAYVTPDDSEVYVAAIDSHPTPTGCENTVAIVAWEIEYP